MGFESLCRQRYGRKRFCGTIRAGAAPRRCAEGIAEPDRVLPDPVYERRRRYYLRGAGPSRWLLVVVSYEQEPARLISAFGNRKDPRSWSE